jgi:hypothetical protein
MKRLYLAGIALSGACFVCTAVRAQPPVQAPPPPPVEAQPGADTAPPFANLSPVPLDWVPPALEHLNHEAVLKESFTLDRTLLALAAGMIPDSEPEDRQVIRKLDGVSVHVLRFAPTGVPDEREVASIRDAYHLRGWKHLVTTTESGGPVRNGTTDMWVVLDGVNVRGVVLLAETPRSLTLITVSGNLDPIDLLHLRGHLGIPRFNGDRLRERQ